LGDEIARLLKVQERKNILDVGCGDGRDLVKMRKGGFTGAMYGNDIAEGILQAAHEMNAKEKTNINFVHCDAEDQCFRDELFEVAFLKHSLQNFFNPLKGLQETWRILRPGGEVAIANNGEKTRVVFRELRPKIAELLKLNAYPDSDKIFNIDTNIPELVGKVFKNPTVTKFESEIRLKDVQPYVDYIDSGRSWWGEALDTEWQKALDFSREYLENIVKEKGEVVDHLTIGVIVATKEV
jgi:ubiquinone/menaquinone biosynthesis C-methylase UbiE